MMAGRKAYPTDLTDAQWALIAPLVLQPKGKRGRPRRVDTREVVNAIFYVVRTGCQWRLLPHDFPAWQTVYYYYNKWSQDGTWDKVMALVREKVRVREGRDPEPTAGIMDSQTVKSSETSGERGWDGGKKIKGRKRHLVVDTLGLPLDVWVTGADATDGEVGADLLEHVKARIPTLSKVWVDGAYAGLVEGVGQAVGVKVEVVRRSRGQRGFTPLPRRWVIERRFGWLNRYRRLSKDFEYWEENSASMVKIAFIQLMLRRLAFSTG